MMNGIAFFVVVAPRSRRCQRSGSQIVRRPTTICAARTTVITSNTWVTPPVGSGKAGTNISSMIVTAKLFSANTSLIAPSVFGSSLWSQVSSCVAERRLAGRIHRDQPASTRSAPEPSASRRSYERSRAA